MYAPRTLVALQEATIRNVRSGREAFGSAALGARMSPGKKASVYVGPKGQYSYGIQSKSTGGKTTPKGFRRVGEISPGTGGARGSTVLKRADSKSRMKKQMDRIQKSSRLSPDEKARYMAAAQKQKGRTALPSGARAAMRQATYGVDPKRKVAGIAQRKKAIRTPQSVVAGAARKLGRTLSGLLGRKRKVA
jgi:hypothetical protein